MLSHQQPNERSRTAKHNGETSAPSDFGVGQEERKDVVVALARLLADTYVLYLKTQNFHWNVTGPSFRSLHELFEEQYLQLAAAVDEVAERIRALGGRAPGSFREFLELTSIAEADGTPPADEMIRTLLQDHETTIRTARTAIDMCEGARDAAGVDLTTRRIAEHEKNAWMLRALLEG